MLFCRDVLVPALLDETQLRPVNVHLDSLPTKFSKQPEQLSIMADLIREARHGLVAGYFNAILSEDDTLIQDNG